MGTTQPTHQPMCWLRNQQLTDPLDPLFDCATMISWFLPEHGSACVFFHHISQGFLFAMVLSIVTLVHAHFEPCLSYNGTDRAWAEWIAWQLEEEHFTTILQAWDFRPGGNFVLKMQEASERAHRTIAVLSPNYLNADFTQPEWAAAFRRDPQGAKGILVPVMVRDCKRELAGLWPQIIYIDLVDLNEQAARKALLTGINLGRNKPITALVFPGAIKHIEAEGPDFPGGTSSDASAKLSKEKLALPKLKLNRSFNPYQTRDEWIEYLTSNLQEAIEGEAPLDFYADDVEGHRQIRILRNQDTIYSLNVKKGGFGSGDAGIVFSSANRSDDI